MEDSTKEYAKRFNQGYLLAKHEPELLAQITKGNENSDYIKTMKQGAKEAGREKVREQLRGNSDQPKTPDKGMDID